MVSNLFPKNEQNYQLWRKWPVFAKKTSLTEITSFFLENFAFLGNNFEINQGAGDIYDIIVI